MTWNGQKSEEQSIASVNDSKMYPLLEKYETVFKSVGLLPWIQNSYGTHLHLNTIFLPPDLVNAENSDRILKFAGANWKVYYFDEWNKLTLLGQR